LECRGGADWLPDTPPSLTFYRHTLALSVKADWLFSRFESRVRGAIRKAERNGVVVEASSQPEAIATYYTLHCQTRQKHGLPPQPFSFFRNLQRHVIAPGGGQVFLARHQDVPLAGAVFLHSGSQVVYKFAASDESGLHLRPNDRLIWEAIQWYGNHGFTTLDFGRTSLANEGLRRFKLGWGTTETTIGYLKYDLRQDAFVTDHDRAAGWYNRVFSRLPTPVLRCLGQLVYPHLA
jgi:lipid II:glycine glycyltransferase (peptidoglycan interpeptide bridge formation enzyme)